ncbi:MAG: hypothetical protein J0I21_08755 [Alphaproteobacteria bacterium]|nr:hypothetical protein [Alphaproteobacteria bacterium]
MFGTPKHQMTNRGLLAATLVLALGLDGCMGAGLLARAAGKTLFGEKEKPPAERIATAQEQAISAVHGGNPGTPIAWSDAKSGIEGALLVAAGGEVANGCRAYQQTVILAGETLQGRLVACSGGDGKWKLSGTAGQMKQ